MSLERKFSSGVAWMSAGNWIEQAINFIVFALLARLLGVEAFGFLAMAAAFVLVSEFLVRESISEVLLTRDDPSPERLSSVFWMLAGFGAALALLLVLISDPVARMYGEPQVGPLILALSPTVPMIALTAVPVAILRREMQFRVLALRAIAGVVAGGVVGIGMAWAGFGVWSLAGQRLAQVGVNIVMAWAAVTWRPSLTCSRRHMREVMGFASQVVGLRAAELTAIQMPAVIIGVTLGPVQAGLFSIAWRVVEIASFLIVTPLRMVSQPAFGAMTRAGGVASNLLLDIMRMAGLAVFPAFAGLAVLSGPLLVLLFGEKWTDAAPVLSVMAGFGVYLCIEKVQQSFCLAAGRIGVVSVLAWCEVALGAALILAASRFGLTALTAGFVAAFLIVWVFRFRNVAAIAGVPVRALAGVHLPPILGALVMAGGVFWLRAQMTGLPLAAQVGLGTLAGIAIFGGYAALFLRVRLRLVARFAGAGAAPGAGEAG
ncbi:hypothetical protein DDZ14_07550 [Maritimibacter sp. 55A14]|uniref:oligosaccharide flippase family protein n=1 Tax=Maritimibacter sp. 55A14 TaxID=2174844 RepID=UPI000D6123AD|nr:oligosaccharide flippase family protein [Maritimibacter sp. 55A14]PWE32937.1 hypothetical protein DDZ14_07550 [Maritimibacter sp. 55A14]